VVSVLATGPKGRGFKPGRGHEFLSAIKVRSLGSSNKSTSQGRIIHFFREVPPDLLLDDSADRIARELWRTNQFSPVGIIPPWCTMLIYNLGDEQ
jgi:hypothetical protein